MTPRPTVRRRVARIVLWGGAATVVLALVATGRLFLWPVTDDVDAPNAVALFVGGRGERLATALELMERHDVPHLVIPNGTVLTWPEANELCGESQDFRVWCPTPRPDTTRGEARAIANLAAQQGWDRLAIVTSDYHVTRARLLLSRCFDGDIAVVSANSGLGVFARGARIGHEWIAFLRAKTFDRSC